MRPFSAFSAPGKWFRGNCHTHTHLSDGQQDAEEICEFYREAGYAFVVLTDHRATQPEVASLQRKGFLVINGVELHPPVKSRAPVPHHILGIGVEAPVPARQRKGVSARSTIHWIRRNGGIAVYAHPYWSGHDMDQMKEGRSAFGVEVFNTVTEAVKGLGDSSVHLDHALRRGYRWRVFAADDTHSTVRDGLGAWIMVRAKSLTRNAIMSALRKGHFYASCGPEIHALAVRRGIARIACSPVSEIVWHTWGRHGRREASDGAPITSADFKLSVLPPICKYLRIELTDAYGHKAWTQPIWRNNDTGRWTD